MSEKPPSAKKMLNQCITQHFIDAATAKAKGEPVGWATSIFPQEFCETMGLQMVYPENFAAIIAAKHGAQAILDIAEGEGYDVDICSYAKLGLGHIKEQIAEIPLPLPDFVCCCNNICNTVLKWFENIATELNIPLLLIDVPYNHNYEPTPHSIAYIRAQFDKIISQLEEITGRSFDQNRFEEVMRTSNRVSRAWKKAIDMGRTIPAPLNGFDSFNFMALIVEARGNEQTAVVFEKLVEELEEKAAQGESCYPEGEKYRFMWDGIACWPYVGQNMRSFKDKHINIVTSTFPDAWLLMYEPGNLDELARAYTMVGNNACMEFQADRRTQSLREFNVDGMLFHINRSCKVMDFMQYEQHRQVFKRTGIPIATFDGDQADPRNFSPAQFETRLEALTEMIDQRKDAKAKRGDA
ncbi:MAG: 2-hydroxyacyl-CoA dehydratase family protein [Syntrophomonadaceae bacterium]|nr:2-hydroxyacyl-CoA dehydratase family protein [Syntrophomonadaceae bacterium]